MVTQIKVLSVEENLDADAGRDNVEYIPFNSLAKQTLAAVDEVGPGDQLHSLNGTTTVTLECPGGVLVQRVLRGTYGLSEFHNRL